MKTFLTKRKSGSRTSGVIFLQKVDQIKLQQARVLRRKMTAAENILWTILRNRKVAGFKFRRQQIIEGFIVDFYCEVAKLAIEVDGSIHDLHEQKQIDELRSKVFQARGISVIRFKNDEIETNPDSVVEKLKYLLVRISDTPLLAERGGQRPG